MNDKTKHIPVFRASVLKHLPEFLLTQKVKKNKIGLTIPTAQDCCWVESIYVLRHSDEDDNIWSKRNRERTQLLISFTIRSSDIFHYIFNYLFFKYLCLPLMPDLGFGTAHFQMSLKLPHKINSDVI